VTLMIQLSSRPWRRTGLGRRDPRTIRPVGLGAGSPFVPDRRVVDDRDGRSRRRHWRCSTASVAIRPLTHHSSQDVATFNCSRQRWRPALPKLTMRARFPSLPAQCPDSLDRSPTNCRNALSQRATDHRPSERTELPGLAPPRSVPTIRQAAVRRGGKPGRPVVGCAGGAGRARSAVSWGATTEALRSVRRWPGG
jgi:hypothetical protein